MKKKVGFKTLGCRLNQFETDALASKFVGLGYEVAEDSRNADVFVVNTCTVTNQSDQKSRSVVNKAINQGHTGMMIITGCMANHHKEQLEKRYPNAYVVNNEQKSAIPQLVEAHFNKEILPANESKGGVFSYVPAAETFHTRSMIKIQDGCDNYCTFCIIPKVRGRAVSRSVDDILENIRQVVGFGYKEVVITGVNISRYLSDGVGFSGLLKQIVDIDLDFRVRISSIEPDSFDDDFFKLLEHPKITPHLHLCLQSASESVLLQMRRMYTYKLYKRIVEKLRNINPLFNITTDIIVGFPGETESDFAQSLSALEELGFGHVHTFKYSKREDTRAARMTKVIDEREKSKRSELMRQKSLHAKIKYRQQFIGQSLSVLIDTVKDDFSKGYGEYYVPVKINQKLEKNHLHTLTITGIETGGDDPCLIAERIAL
ncbi:tRNA (N(6)-L-threonylcarbamoyladenosine(37)-C(2))-methylthiotransferase MtaB [Carboxylicivirga sp. M1479]|uniref:tRNA (N(6)-L-threonylcarbamoyladenosine(37)-C(2))- methylthiotransferase MtaB n=1 Tax=Carboxylicivirga sp. M1479 TaxID=2594476 RepID=UPI001177EF32|nr:tRNA (N(6)-L-threonylcarbamoyladenosine(37)-C(2))-methylthiotransferase MtaB [Carboxylicivirga sp. M1479]TRX70302.1 tRNA (N(6)-L-threonylcarbamoyladenosine(37)-C(2))-methylthiotransferase MtaB [Carboxylicivirga sp. M1479]